ncbi:hypothetical protein AB0L74_34505 [Streptomyces sp. NPDC052020]|uniref:hypothetical protein n=1 Tax=Streptomyces sp. NPDC052020 TaxID=3155677 RepID=UPI00341A48AE
MATRSTTHAARPPASCGTCTKIHTVLLQRRALGQPVTGAAIAAAAGVSRQVALIHIRYLVECGWVAADRRTAIPQTAPAPPPPARSGTPLTWATDAALSCRTCGRILLILATAAGGEWSVVMPEHDLADALGVTGRTVRTHLAALTGRRPHAHHTQAGPLLRGELVPETGGRGGRRFTFLDGQVRPGSSAETYTAEEYSALRVQALDVLAQVPLLTQHLTARERTRAAELLVIPRLHIGYPPAAIAEALVDPTDLQLKVHTSAYGLIKWRLEHRAPLSGYVAPAKETYDPTPRVHDCADCGLPINAPVSVLYCRTCKQRRAAGISIEVAEAHPIRA